MFASKCWHCIQSRLRRPMQEPETCRYFRPFRRKQARANICCHCCPCPFVLFTRFLNEILGTAPCHKTSMRCTGARLTRARRRLEPPTRHLALTLRGSARRSQHQELHGLRGQIPQQCIMVYLLGQSAELVSPARVPYKPS